MSHVYTFPGLTEESNISWYRDKLILNTVTMYIRKLEQRRMTYSELSASSQGALLFTNGSKEAYENHLLRLRRWAS